MGSPRPSILLGMQEFQAFGVDLVVIVLAALMVIVGVVAWRAPRRLPWAILLAALLFIAAAYVWTANLDL
jgi:hypothetical protein